MPKYPTDDIITPFSVFFQINQQYPTKLCIYLAPTLFYFRIPEINEQTKTGFIAFDKFVQLRRCFTIKRISLGALTSYILVDPYKHTSRTRCKYYNICQIRQQTTKMLKYSTDNVINPFYFLSDQSTVSY